MRKFHQLLDKTMLIEQKTCPDFAWIFFEQIGCYLTISSGPIAQSVERRTFNPQVEGSIPSWLTTRDIHGCFRPTPVAMVLDKMSLSSRGLGHRPFTPATRVRLPLGTQIFSRPFLGDAVLQRVYRNIENPVIILIISDNPITEPRTLCPDEKSLTRTAVRFDFAQGANYESPAEGCISVSN